jgi:hypothetical protein
VGTESDEGDYRGLETAPTAIVAAWRLLLHLINGAWVKNLCANDMCRIAIGGDFPEETGAISFVARSALLLDFDQ